LIINFYSSTTGSAFVLDFFIFLYVTSFSTEATDTFQIVIFLCLQAIVTIYGQTCCMLTVTSNYYLDR